MTDLKIRADGLLIENGDLQLHTNNAELVQQRLDINLNLYRGEWWLNNLSGVPYIQEVLSKRVNVGVADSILKDAILNTKGVDTLKSYSSELNPLTGNLVVSFEVLTTNGEIVSIQNREF